MFKDTILKRLSDGENLDEIAADLEASLNAAKAEYEATKAADQKERTLNDIAEAMLYDLYEYIEAADPKLFETLNFAKDPSAKDIAEIRSTIDSLIQFLPALLKVVKGTSEKSSEQKTASDPFESFFKAFGL